MLTYRTGVAGGQAAAASMAEHLLQRTLPETDMLRAAYYAGETAPTAEALALEMGSVPIVRADLPPELAAALRLTPGGLVRPAELANILSGLSAQGDDLPGQQRDVRTYTDADGNERHRITYTDFTFSVPKSVSVAWMAAETHAERNSIVQACRTANAKLMRYVEQEIGIAGFGKGRAGGEEPASMAWITVSHFTSRPTLAITRPDPVTGVVDTELVDVLRDGLMPGDPQIHFHNVTPNLLHTESGRFVSMNRHLLAGRVHEFGAVGQAFLTAELEAIGIRTALDERTQLLTLPAIPEPVCREFSKRTEQAEDAAREIARDAGMDWDTLDPDRKVAMLKGRAQAGREGKGDDLGDVHAWKLQTERLGWEHKTAIEPDRAPAPERDVRLETALHVGREVFAPVVQKRAVVGKGDIRLAAARGLIAAGGTRDAADVSAVTRAMAKRGVRQDGQVTTLLWRDAGQAGVKITTALHRDQEAEVVRLAQAAAADTSRALTPAQIDVAVAASAVDFESAHGQKQRAIIARIGSGGALGVFVGAAGIGKTTGILPPLVKAWQTQGRDVWGTAQAWRQAGSLQEAGIDRLNCRALQPLLDGIAAGRTTLTANSVVVVDELSQVGTRQLLELMRHQQRIGFQLTLTGGERQCQSIAAGPVIALLRKAVGPEAIPEILTTVRQQSEREREIAGLFMAGQERAARRAIDMLREDGHAELVPGGYQAAVERVADKWMALTEANRADPHYTVSASAPTNRDAQNISRSIRERRQALGVVSRDEVAIKATDSRGEQFGFSVAAGDQVRLYERTRGVFRDEQGRGRSAHIGDNGSVLRVVEVLRDPQQGGLRLETANGKVGFVSWSALRDAPTGRTKLALGYCLTIDSAQGITSDEHISAMPGGSVAVQAFKAYSQGSRHRIAHHLIGSAGAEMRDAEGRRPAGVKDAIDADALWANVARNLSRAPMKELATDMLGEGAQKPTDSVKAFQRTLRGQEFARAAGEPASRVREQMRQRQTRTAMAEVSRRFQAVAGGRVPALQEAAQQARTRTPAPSQPARKPQAQQHPLAPGAARWTQVSEQAAQHQFRAALAGAGFDVARMTGPVLDGQPHLAPMAGDRDRTTLGRYRAFHDGACPAVWWQDMRTGEQGSFKAAGERVALDPAEAERIARRQVAMMAQRERQRGQREGQGARTAQRTWDAAKPATADHPYLTAKGIEPDGLRVTGDGTLVVPLSVLEDGTRRLVTLQMITADGTTRPIYGARQVGAHFVVGRMEAGQPIAFAAGLATATSFHAATGMATVMTVDASGLGPVAAAYRTAHPTARFVFAADNDAHLPKRQGHRRMANVGVEKAEAAARMVGHAVVLVAPELPERTAADKGTDWHDYRAAKGRGAALAAAQEKMPRGQDLPNHAASQAQKAPEQSAGIEMGF